MAYVDSKHFVNVQYATTFRLILQNPHVNKSTSPNTTQVQRRGTTGTTFDKLHCNVIWQHNTLAGPMLKTVIYSSKMIKT